MPYLRNKKARIPGYLSTVINYKISYRNAVNLLTQSASNMIFYRSVRISVGVRERQMRRGHVELGQNFFDCRLKSWPELERDIVERCLVKQLETDVRLEATEPIVMNSS